MGESLFFVDAAASGPALYGSHGVGLALLSLVVSVFSATMALQTARVARKAHNPFNRHVAIATGAIALGGGIWTMHFIGMMAFELPAPVHFAVAPTLLSLLPAWIASASVLHLLGGGPVSALRLLACGMLVGLGVGAMHYVGMSAMRTPLQMRFAPFPFLLSIGLAVTLPALSLWVQRALGRTALSSLQRLLAGGTLLGLAIASMHYAGMSTLRFHGEPGMAATGIVFDTGFAALGLSAVTIAVSVLVAALNGLMRSRELFREMENGRLRLQAILDTAVDGIITIDSRGLIQSMNQSAERLFGWTAAEVTGRNIKMLMPEPDQSRHDGYLENYRRTGVPKIIGSGREVVGLRKDGSLMPMRLAVGRVDLPGELLFVGFVSDISNRIALEASLRETAERAERAAAAKSTFLANMSHEIRTPMNSIIGFTELLLQGNLTATQRSQLGTIRQSSRALLGLINDILDTTRMEKDRLKLETIDFSLKELALQIASSLGLAAQAKQLTLATVYPPQMPEYFRGDPLRVLQVLTNLVGNAIKFTEKGGVELRFSQEGDQVHVQVRDTGIGMTPRQMTSIFAAFSQADPSIGRRFGGTGLGTTISRQLVELMGGCIEVESEIGQGSCFHVWLPLPVGGPPAHAAPEVPRTALPPLRILIVDDVAQNLELLALTLQSGGHTLEMARDGAEAVEKFIAGRFDVVLMDVHMPGVDGLQATRLIRQHERAQGRAATPVIALTASVMEEDRRAARQAGMDGFAVKPLEVPRLVEEMARVLGLGDDPAPRPQAADAGEASARTASGGDEPLADLGAALRALEDLLAHNEIDSELVDAVCGALERLEERERAHALLAAIDEFEFGRARALVQQLLQVHGSLAQTGSHSE
ncbi:MHYT domain-containing protein [Pseudorhodoferax sp.]|uniref:MHYT domain-containing protein n=1 Tax=Pseudorhodoferax sp. TaxID=1993553 RepID=UPI0039E29EB1